MTRQFDIRRSLTPDPRRDQDNNELLQEIADKVVRSDNPFVDFTGRVFARTFSNAGTFEVGHNLGYVPTDFIVTNNSAGATVYTGFADRQTIEIITSAATTIRFLLGRF